MDNKKIALVLNTAWNIFNFRLNLVKAIKDKGYEVLLIAPSDKYVEKLNHLGKYIPIQNMQKNGTNPWRDFRLLRELRSIYQEEKPDLILHFTIKPNIYGGLAAQHLGIPHLCTVTGIGSFPLPSGLVNSIVQKLYKQSFKSAEKIIFQNKEDRNDFIKAQTVAEHKSTVVPGSGVDVNLFQPKENNRPPELAGKVIFLMVARLIVQKGIIEYVEAARNIRQKYPNTEFWILGGFWDHPEAISKSDVEQWESEGLIQYKGVTDNVKSYMNIVDIVTLPSYYGEGVPRTLLESLAMAKPIITTNHKGCKEVVEQGKNGYLVPVRDVTALTDAFSKIIDIGKEVRLEMGRHSRQKAIKEFNDKIVIQSYLDEIKRILG